MTQRKDLVGILGITILLKAQSAQIATDNNPPKTTDQ